MKFVNCGGQVIVQNSNFRYGISLENCKYFRITGTGDPAFRYGINIAGTGANASGLSISGLSSDFEVDHIEVANTGFAGIEGKSEPRCDLSTNKGMFTQRNVSYHDNYIHDVVGEGIYAGHSFYFTGIVKNCNGVNVTLYPHEITGIRVYNNIVSNTGWDAIQVGCAIADCEIYNNTITNYATRGSHNEMSGIQINPGTTGKCYNNIVKIGTGNGITLLGQGNNMLFNNLIIEPGRNFFPTDPTKRVYGIFCDDRGTTQGTYFHFINNTIISPKTDGIRMYTTKTVNNRVSNNIIINPGAYASYGQRTYVYLNPGVSAVLSNNFFDMNFSNIRFVNPAAHDYRLLSSSPAVDTGLDVAAFGITTDQGGQPRPSGNGYDMGVYEYSSTTVSAAEEIAAEVPAEEKFLAASPSPSFVEDVHLYPNPAEEVLHITSTGSLSTPTRYEVADMNGRVVLKLQNDQPGETETLSIANLPQGTYLLHIYVKDKTISRKFKK